MSRSYRIGCALLALWMASSEPAAMRAAAGGALTHVKLAAKVTNLETAAYELKDETPLEVRKKPALEHKEWYGQIMRRLPGDGMDDTGHYVPFVVEYVAGIASRVWVDGNLNGDLGDDAPLPLFVYPAIADARCAIATLSWVATADDESVPITSIVRIVLEPFLPLAIVPRCRIQSIYAMQGLVDLDGRPRLIVLYDGNGDGLYTADPHDGFFIDRNGDRTLDVHLSSEEFFPMRVPFRIGGAVLEVASVDRSGKELVLRNLGRAPEVPRAQVGPTAPDFECYDTDGRRFRLSSLRGRPVILNFWASWCSFCRGQAARLSELYQARRGAGLEILGISLDTDRSSMASFRSETGETWPTTYSGGMYWEDAVARLYGVDGAGGCYLIDGSGRLVGVYYDVAELEAKLSESDRAVGAPGHEGD